MYDKNEVIYSSGIGVCRVSDIVNLTVNKKTPIQYYLLSSVFDKNRTSYIPVNNHQVVLRKLLTPDEAKIRKEQEGITELEKKEIAYVLEHN